MKSKRKLDYEDKNKNITKKIKIKENKRKENKRNTAKPTKTHNITKHYFLH